MFVASWGVVVSSWLQSWGALRAILALVRGGVGWGGGSEAHVCLQWGFLVGLWGISGTMLECLLAPCWSDFGHHTAQLSI